MVKLVTVYMPTHNRKAFANRAIRSVLQQSYTNIEMIVVDDGSTDGTYEDLTSINDPRLKVLRNDYPRGACYSRNKAIFSARGEYITGLDDDDYFASNRIEVLLNAYEPHFSFLYDAGVEYREGLFFAEKKEKKWVGLHDILQNNIGNQVFTETKKLKNVGGFDERLISSQDYDLWTRLILKYGHAQKIDSATYYFDISHDLPRISTSPKAIKGAEMYLEKYKNLMTPLHLSCQYKRMTYYGRLLTFKESLLVAQNLGAKELFFGLARAIYVRFI